MDRPACQQMADSLASAQKAVLSLALRSLDLSVAEAQKLALIFSEWPAEAEFALQSISFSYNKTLGDAGAIALAEALPTGLLEFGMVGCDIGDAGAKSVLKWAKRASALRMICIEGNPISTALKSEFYDLRQTHQGILVVV